MAIESGFQGPTMAGQAYQEGATPVSQLPPHSRFVDLLGIRYLRCKTAAGGELSTEPVLRSARTLTVNLRPELIADQEEVRASIDNDAINLVDSLPEIHYRGEWTMYDQPGHIPGAVNVPVTSLFDEAGQFRTDEELSGLVPGDRAARTITYCGGGIAASADAFVLTRLGFTDVAIYAASLEEWTANSDNPMEVNLEDFE